MAVRELAKTENNLENEDKKFEETKMNTNTEKGCADDGEFKTHNKADKLNKINVILVVATPDYQSSVR